MRASARTSTSCPFRGLTEPTHSRRGGSPAPGPTAACAGSVPGATTRTREAGKPYAPSRRAVKALVTTAPVHCARDSLSNRVRRASLDGLQPRLVGKGMVDECDQPQAVSVRPERVGEGAHGETVQDHPGALSALGALGDLRKGAGEAGLRARVALGESALQPMGDHRPSQRRQALDDPRVVEGSAGPPVERPRNDEMELPRAQTDPSKDAQATCDSLERHAQSLEASRSISEAAVPDRYHEPVEDRCAPGTRSSCSVPVNSASSSRLRKSSSPRTSFKTAPASPMSTTRPSESRWIAPEGGVDYVGGSVEPLGRSEDLAPEAVGDHEVIANVQAVQ